MAPQKLSGMERIATSFLVVVDLACWLLSSLLVILFVPNNNQDISFFATGPILAMIALYLVNGYNRKTEFMSLEYFSEHFIALILSAICAMLVIYLYSAFNYCVKPSRAMIPFQLGLFSLLSIAARRFVGARIESRHALGTLLVIGKGKKTERFCRNCIESGIKQQIELIDPSFESAPQNRFRFLKTKPQAGDKESVPVQLGGCIEVVLACDTAELHPTILRQLIQLHCSGVAVRTVEAFQEHHWQRVSASTAGPDWLFDSEFRLAQGSIYSQLKRLLDIVFALVALVGLSPALLFICAIVRLDSRGPVIFRQERVGREGRPFTMCKFRTMHENSGEIYTQEEDKRITRSGRWLRLFRLDELPQLWNVLVGDMSLIGPRAEWTKCAEIYELEIPHYHIRHLVHPGITGWAQVKFRYGTNTDDALRKFEYDLYYIRHFSFEMDMQIVIKTIYTMILGKGR